MGRTREHRSYTCSAGCAVEATLTVIGGKWKGVVLHHLQEGPRRFGELRRVAPEVSQRVLTAQLRELEADGLIVRTVYAEVPPRVDYRLSPLGETLAPVLAALRSWGEAHLDLSPAPPAAD